jgi:hypothetical protein
MAAGILVLRDVFNRPSSAAAEDDVPLARRIGAMAVAITALIVAGGGIVYFLASVR